MPQSCLIYRNIKDYDPYPSLDWTTAIQQAIDDAESTGGGVVFFPAGVYLVSGHITIKNGVRLQGEVEAVQDTYKRTGAVIHSTYGQGTPNADALFTLLGGTSVSGLSVYYPNQLLNTTIKKYPFTFYIKGGNCTVENITLYNSYQGIKFGDYELNQCAAEHLVRNVYGTVLKVGVQVDFCNDIGRIENIHFIPAYWVMSSTATPDNPDDDHMWVQKQMINNLTAFSFGFTDWEYIRETFVWCAKIGYHFYRSERVDSQGYIIYGMMNGEMSGVACDRVITGFKIDYLKSIGLIVSNAQIDANATVEGLAVNNGVLIENTCEGNVRFTNCNFFGYQDHNVLSHGTGFLALSNCCFRNFETETSWAQVRTDNGRLQINCCSFATSSNRDNILIGLGTDHAIIIGNNALNSVSGGYQGGIKYSNEIGSNAIISENECAP